MTTMLNDIFGTLSAWIWGPPLIIILIGTGRRQVFLKQELMMFLYRRQTGFEVMTTEAAARTFNVLVSEGRNVVAALLPVIEENEAERG